MGGGKLAGFLLIQVHLHPGVGQPQCGFAPGQTGPNDLTLHSSSTNRRQGAAALRGLFLFHRFGKFAALFGAVQLALFLEQGIAALGAFFGHRLVPGHKVALG